MTYHAINQDKIVDYVLGLLDSAESQSLEQHATICADCRQAIAAERKLASQMRSTIAALPRPNHAHMMRLMPAAPQKRSFARLAHRWQHAAAVAAMLVMLIVGSFGINWSSTSPDAIASPVPAHVHITETATQNPTATATQDATPTTFALLTVTPIPVQSSR